MNNVWLKKQTILSKIQKEKLYAFLELYVLSNNLLSFLNRSYLKLMVRNQPMVDDSLSLKKLAKLFLRHRHIPTCLWNLQQMTMLRLKRS